MSDYLRNIDNSKNMEDLRNARSYNDLVVILSRVKSATSSISSKLNKKLGVLSTPEKIEVSKDKDFTIDRTSLLEVHENLNTLLAFDYELKYSQTKTDTITSDLKLKKFRLLLDVCMSSLIKTTSLAYKYLNSVGIRIAPDKLVTSTSVTSKLLSKILDFSKQESVLIPDASESLSFTQYLILRNVRTPTDYNLSEFIVAIHADSNYDDTFSYGVSFPSSLSEGTEKSGFSTATQLRALLKKNITYAFRVTDIKELSDNGKRNLDLMLNVLFSTVENGVLRIELESGVTSSGINVALTKILAIAHSALGVDQRDVDIIHRVETGPQGNKSILISLLNRVTYNMPDLIRLQTVLQLDTKTFKAIKAIAEA